MNTALESYEVRHFEDRNVVTAKDVNGVMFVRKFPLGVSAETIRLCWQCLSSWKPLCIKLN